MGTTRILDESIISIYNFPKVRKRVKEVFGILSYLSIVDNELPLPTITPNYTVRYNQFIPVSNSKIENYVMKKIMLEAKDVTRRTILLSKITVALKKLTVDELKVFNMMFYENKTDECINNNMPYCIDIVINIKKSACIKFVLSLGIDYDLFK